MPNNAQDPRILAMLKITNNAITIEKNGSQSEESFRKSLALFVYLKDSFDKEFGAGRAITLFRETYRNRSIFAGLPASATAADVQKAKQVGVLMVTIPNKFIEAAKEDKSYQYHLHHYSAKDLLEYMQETLQILEPKEAELKPPSEFGPTTTETSNYITYHPAPTRLSPDMVAEIKENKVAEHHQIKFLLGTINNRLNAINSQHASLKQDLNADPSDLKTQEKIRILETASQHLTELKKGIEVGNLPDLQSPLVQQILELKTDPGIQTKLQAPRKSLFESTLWGSTTSTTVINETADDLKKAVIDIHRLKP